VHYVDVLESAEGMRQMQQHAKGNRRVPVIVDAGQVTIGFDGGS
jgi:glutaredoxin